MPTNPTSLPFNEAVQFFRNKLNIPTEHWNDIWRSAHDTAFMVAGAAKADLVTDLRHAVHRAVVNGESLGEFRNRFDDIVRASGWEHTGHASWRSRVIVETNLRTSYQAGRYRQMTDPAHMLMRPYWQYRHGPSIRPRPQHLAWHGLTLPADHDWFQTHYAPNGWGCKCTIVSLSKRDVERRKDVRLMDEPPDDGTYVWTDKRTGEKHTLPKGIEPGWDYAPGASLVDRTRDQVERKIPALPKEAQQDLREILRQSYVPATSVKQAEVLARKRWNLADDVDYGGFDLSVANAINRSLVTAFRDYPSMRDHFGFVGSTQARNELWRKRAIDAVMHDDRFADMDPNLARTAIAQSLPVLSVPHNQLGVAFDNAYVRGVALNQDLVNDGDQLQKIITKRSKTGLYPSDMDMKSMMDHEFGHVMEIAFDLRHNSEILSVYKRWLKVDPAGRKLSRNAKRNIKEFIADCWLEYRNSAAPRSPSIEVGQIMERVYHDRAGKDPGVGR